jgi:hypothetical protein
VASWTQDARDEGYKIINIEDSWRVPGAICVFLASFDSTQDLYEQFAAVRKRTHAQKERDVALLLLYSRPLRQGCLI